MSLSRLVFPQLGWSELWEILSFLSLPELWTLGSTCRTGFITFLREKTYRAGCKSRILAIHQSKLALEDSSVEIEELLNNNRLLLSSGTRFLPRYSNHNKILLVSYPRSGNSYLRKILELRTGIITGSDSRPNRVLAASLLSFGYCGEGIVDQSVWIVKSHFPERLGYIRFPVDKAILVVRNPFDAIESYFHMAMTNTHDKVLTTEVIDPLKLILHCILFLI
jgi:hypothetical protein